MAAVRVADNPSSATAHKRLGIVLYGICGKDMTRKHWDEAARLCEEALGALRKAHQLEPSNRSYNEWLLYGLRRTERIYQTKGQTAKSCELFREAEPLLSGPLARVAESARDKATKDAIRKGVAACR